MVTKTWYGSDGAFATDADWNAPGTPGVGDTAVINAGTVTVTGSLSTTTVQLTSNAGNSPTLVLNGGTILSGNQLFVTGVGNDATLQVVGASTNGGNLTFQGSNPVLRITGGSSAVTLTNTGGMSITGAGSITQATGNGSIVNTGVISYRAAAGTTQTDTLNSSLSGTGQIRISGAVNLSLSGQVSSGQTVVFEKGIATLFLPSFGAYQGSVSGFSNTDVLSGIGARWTDAFYQQTSDGGNLQFRLANGVVVDSVHFIGSYSPSASFSISQSASGGALSQTDIRVADGQQPTRFNINDQVTGVISQDPGIAYYDPNVPTIQYRYVYTGNDSVVLGANVPNVFMNGGPAGDALNAFGGSNVLDGGGGSNFLVGATGADGGVDQFYVDERGSAETWSTLVNFHKGDSATIFGFKGGFSTEQLLASDGVNGYQGVTIHSAINGLGTPINGSVTFTGVTMADFNAKFTGEYGNIGGLDYLLIKQVA